MEIDLELTLARSYRGFYKKYRIDFEETLDDGFWDIMIYKNYGGDWDEIAHVLHDKGKNYFSLDEDWDENNPQSMRIFPKEIQEIIRNVLKSLKGIEL